MPIVMHMEWENVTPEQYDEVKRITRFEIDVAAGGLYHVCAFDGTTMRVVDVWETAESFQSFVDTRLMPAVQQLGLPGQPKVTILPVHNIFAPGYTAKAAATT